MLKQRCREMDDTTMKDRIERKGRKKIMKSKWRERWRETKRYESTNWMKLWNKCISKNNSVMLFRSVFLFIVSTSPSRYSTTWQSCADFIHQNNMSPSPMRWGERNESGMRERKGWVPGMSDTLIKRWRIAMIMEQLFSAPDPNACKWPPWHLSVCASVFEYLQQRSSLEEPVTSFSIFLLRHLGKTTTGGPPAGRYLRTDQWGQTECWKMQGQKIYIHVGAAQDKLAFNSIETMSLGKNKLLSLRNPVFTKCQHQHANLHRRTTICWSLPCSL